jgi:hypothetical protein
MAATLLKLIQYIIQRHIRWNPGEISTYIHLAYILYFVQGGNQKNIEGGRGIKHRGILRIETALTGVSVSGRTVRRLFT